MDCKRIILQDHIGKTRSLFLEHNRLPENGTTDQVATMDCNGIILQDHTDKARSLIRRTQPPPGDLYILVSPYLNAS